MTVCQYQIEDQSVLPSALTRQESDDPSPHSDTEVIEGEYEHLKMQTVATMETKDTTRLEKSLTEAIIKLSISNNDCFENINDSVKKFNDEITDANNNPTHLEKTLTDMMSDSNNNIKRLDNSIEKFKGILSTTIVIFFIPKIIVVFRTDLHKMKINHRIIGEYATKRCFFDIKKLTIVTGS
jgi:hypothetical protein